MRKLTIILMAMTVSLLSFGQENTMVWKSRGTSDQKDVPFVLNINQINALNFDVQSAVVTIDGAEVACQLDDLDGDGRNDELSFVYDQKKGATQTINVTLSAQPNDRNYPSRVYADMMLNDKKGKHPLVTCVEAPGDSYLYNDFYHHGVAFESEQTAYRIYFDHRQNIDLYGKKTYRLELKDTGFYTTEEQMANGYGNDVLWAGNSIGCGSLKLWDGEKPMNWTAVKTRGQRLVANGPVRNVVEVTDRGVTAADGNVYHIKTLYTQYAGHRDINVDVTLDHAITQSILCTGVQKIGYTAEAQAANGGVKAEGYVKQTGLAASWGSDFPEMGKKDLFPPEAVGLAVCVPKEYIATTLEDDLNYLIVIGKPGQKHFSYKVMFGAAKETEGYHNAQEWFKAVEQWGH